MAQEKMRAVRFHEYGPPENLVAEEVPRPEPQDGEVLVRVRAVGVHPFDWKLRKGLVKDFMPVPLPHTPGADFAGVVEAVAAGVEGVQPRDEVYGGGQGTYAEYVVAKVDAIARKPSNLTFAEAAAVPVGGATAWAAVEAAGLEPGERVLVHGGAGGVGEFVVQFARRKGAAVIATASKENMDFVQSLGAEQVIDYSSTRFEDVVNDVDAVIDTVGGEVLERSMQVVKKGGIVVTVAGQPSEERAAELGIRATMVRGQINAKLLNQLTRLIEDGSLRVHVSKVLPLEAASEAQATSETGHSRGSPGARGPSVGRMPSRSGRAGAGEPRAGRVVQPRRRHLCAGTRARDPAASPPARLRMYGATWPSPRTARLRTGRSPYRGSSASASAMAGSTSMRSGGTMAVRRLARLTVVPNTSPIRDTTDPTARPTRSGGTAFSTACVSISCSAVSAASSGASATNNTESPSVLTTRPPDAVTTSAERLSNRSTNCASSSSSSCRLNRVNPTRSAKPTASRPVPASSTCNNRFAAAASCRRHVYTSSRSRSGNSRRARPRPVRNWSPPCTPA